MTESKESIERTSECQPKATRTAVANFLQAQGFSLDQFHISDTPNRVAECWDQHLLNGYNVDPAELLRDQYPSSQTGVILVRDIHFHGMCPHHLLPFVGKAHIAYIPNQHIVGFSKISELVECLTRRLTLQETATQEVVRLLTEELQVKGAGCVMEAQHMCMILRDPQHHTSRITTSAYSGVFEEQLVLQNMLMTQR